MLVSLSSGNYDIVASGQAFLFSKDKDLRIDIQADNGFAFSLILNFIENESVEQDLQLKTNDREIVLTCINFANTGAGVKSLSKWLRLAAGICILFSGLIWRERYPEA